ncbi:hypothetical protein SAMN05421771_4044 [Granulicella pectinivorans]|jgi:hypothetical protein|uniref:Uncharacterized protein n=1 Tax=Granulicella pectinivorans TaxID=474950 RepID=A0A1I6MZT5_9BACT|nr:hypothetical protein SAMN05421771_4044 [Granulicella pectinivorans]
MTTLYFSALVVTYLVNAAYFGTKLVTSANREGSRKNIAGAPDDRCCR